MNYFTIAAFLALLIALGIADLQAAVTRDPAVVREFKRQHPCPATGKSTGPCPGWVADHALPLCLNGADDPSNMWWQPKAEALEKDKHEWALCRWLHRFEEQKAGEQ